MMEKTTNTKTIYRIKNFLDKETYQYFYSFFSEHTFFNQINTSLPVMYSYHNYNSDFTEDSIFIKNINLYQQKVLDAVSRLYGCDVIRFSGTSLRKWYPGEFQPPHSDCEALISVVDDQVHVNAYNNFSSLFIEYAALVYINDSYSGGEIYFPEHNLEIKPEPNELICFPGNSHHRHGVNEVIDGNRFVMQDFLTTPKLRYIWENFVIPDTEINFVDKEQEYYMENKSLFSRSNIPKNFIYNRRPA